MNTQSTVNYLCKISEDVLLRCIAVYLKKQEQYVLFSVCHTLKPLVYQCRTIHIEGSFCACQDSTTFAFPWDMFKKLHQTLLFICANKTVPTRRALRLTIAYTELKKIEDDLKQYIHYFTEIIIRSSGFESESFVITMPTAESIGRMLRSNGKRFNQTKVIGLHNLTSFAEQTYNSMLKGTEFAVVKQKASTSLLSLRGIHDLNLSYGEYNILHVKMSPDSMNKLHCVTLTRCPEITDLIRLQGIPEVQLIDCSNICDVAPLAQSLNVCIRQCVNIRDLSALNHMDTLELQFMELSDISMLGHVRRLVLKMCKVAKYPVPSLGKGQDWEFHGKDILDVSIWVGLEKLTLVDCDALEDITMLGNIQHLTVENCGKLITDSQFPAPLGRLQEWTFKSMIMQNISLSKFNRLHQLQIYYCREIKLIAFHINHLRLFHSSLHSTTISDIEVRDLLLFACYHRSNDDDTMLANVCMAENVNIGHLEVLKSHGLYFTLYFSATTLLQSLTIKSDKCVTIACLTKKDLVDAALLIVLNREEITPYYKLYTLSEINDANKPPTKTFLDKQCLCAAVEIWCWDQDKASRIFGDISNWDVSQVTDMSYLFANKVDFNSNIDRWNVSNVIYMSEMFKAAKSFNQPLENWNVSKVTTMYEMFVEATKFNQPLGSWDVGQVSNMDYMFFDAKSFNQSLNGWDGGNVTTRTYMFNGASSYNQPLDSWNISEVHILEDAACYFDT